MSSLNGATPHVPADPTADIHARNDLAKECLECLQSLRFIATNATADTEWESFVRRDLQALQDLAGRVPSDARDDPLAGDTTVCLGWVHEPSLHAVLFKMIVELWAVTSRRNIRPHRQALVALPILDPSPWIDSDRDTLRGALCTIPLLSNRVIEAELHVEVNRAKRRLQPASDGRPALQLFCRLHVDGAILLRDGKPVKVEATTERRTALLRILSDLISHPSVWRTGTEIAADADQAHVVLDGRRIRRYLNLAPGLSQEFIESDRRKGYRLADSAWRK